MTDTSSTPVGLASLQSEVGRDLQYLSYPPPDWVPQTLGPDGRPILTVLIVGGGMCGQTAAFGLLREGVRNLRVIDRAPYGREGPWGTFARMPTLRSPKHLSGPDLGVPSLTFRAWYEAQHGAAGWETLYKIGRLEWLEYLLWVRRVLQLPVENDTELIRLEPEGPLLRAQLRKNGESETVYARKVVLALGRDGSGAPRWPAIPSFDSEVARSSGKVFHSADDIDFASLRGKKVGVLGAGASAFDNAGTALEAGASEVMLFARRPLLPRVNKPKWASFPGFHHGLVALDDLARWQLLTAMFSPQVPPPHESVLRCDAHANFTLRLGSPWTAVRTDATGVTVSTSHGEGRFDALIFATGFDVDLMRRPEIAAFRESVLTWADRIPEQEAAQYPEEARFPYLGEAFEMHERQLGVLPALGNLHVFNWGATMSHGIARHLFVMDREHHFQAMRTFDENELESTRYGGSQKGE